jgi:hypothetical protein
MTVAAAQVNRRANEVVQTVPRVDVQHTLADKFCITTKLLAQICFLIAGSKKFE